MYDFAQGVNQDYKQSARLNLDAANRGHGEAQCRIANRYDDGLGIYKNQKASYKGNYICFHNKDSSQRDKYWADLKMRSISSVGVLSS